MTGGVSELTETRPTIASDPLSRLLILALGFSGIAGVIYEVALQRVLVRAFGASASATAIVLSAYMAGSGIGAWISGRWIEGTSRPRRAYALLELLIGVCALLTAPASIGCQQLFARWGHGLDPASPKTTLLRIALGFAMVVVPSALMGATIPAAAKAISRLNTCGSERWVALLYTGNVLGAAIGAAMATYVLMPAGGLTWAFRAGAFLNLCAAGIALIGDRNQLELATPAPAVNNLAPASRMLWVASFWSGLTTLAFEVAGTQLLAAVVGSSAYAFGLMLATFLLGLSLGARWASRQPDEKLTPTLLGRVQLGIAATLCLGLPLWDRAPVFFTLLGHNWHFAGREAVRAVVALELLLIPAALMGAWYPLVLRWGARSIRVGRSVGAIASANTVGAIAGSLLAGFLFLPQWGSRVLLLSLLFSACAVSALLLRRSARGLIATAVIGVLGVLMPPWNIAVLASGANVYFVDRTWRDGKVLFAHESVESGFTTVVELKDREHTRVLLTNGKFQGNDSGERGSQLRFAQAPQLVKHGYRRALLIGLGTGGSLAALAAQPFEDIDVAELSGDILVAARRFFGAVNEGSLDAPKVHNHLADGRNLLLLSDGTYDVITIELSSIWFAGASDLYNREFYALMRKHLSQEGVVQQWVQLHHLTRRDLAVILQSMRAELPHVMLMFDGNQAQALASTKPFLIDYRDLTQRSEHLRGTAATRGLPGEDLVSLGASVVLDERGVDQLINEEARAAGVAPSALISTDDNLQLEYSTPKGNARDDLTQETMIKSLTHLGPVTLPLDDGGNSGASAHMNAAVLGQAGWCEEALRAAEDAIQQGAPATELRVELQSRIRAGEVSCHRR